MARPNKRKSTRAFAKNKRGMNAPSDCPGSDKSHKQTGHKVKNNGAILVLNLGMTASRYSDHLATKLRNVRLF
jgi:hypothetical protein